MNSLKEAVETVRNYRVKDEGAPTAKFVIALQLLISHASSLTGEKEGIEGVDDREFNKQWEFLSGGGDVVCINKDNAKTLVDRLAYFYKRRVHAVAKFAPNIPEPYQTKIWNIIANGQPNP